MRLDEKWLRRAAGAAEGALARGGPEGERLRRRGFRAAIDPAILARHDRRYARALPFGRVENQGASGRCWLFAPMVLARAFAIRAGTIAPRERFSETYLHFFNMIEKANATLERMGRALASRGRRAPLHPDTLRRELAHDVMGIADGGEWEWALQLIDRYGIVPAAAMPETVTSAHTDVLLVELHERLARAAHAMGARRAREGHDAIRAAALHDVVRILVAHLGAPPRTVTRRGRALTPVELAREVVGFRAAEWRVVISNPRLDAGAVYRKRASSLAADAQGSARVRFDLARLNAPMARFRELVRRSIERGFAVGFSADVERNDIDRKSGIMHPAIFDRARFYGARPIRDLARREDIFYGVAAANHAMAIVGFDVADRADLGSPLEKFKVVNSWGDGFGDHGVFHLYMPWFEENVFKLALHESVLSPRERAAYAAPPSALPDGAFF